MAREQGAQVVLTEPRPGRRAGAGAAVAAALKAPEWGLLIGIAVVLGAIYYLDTGGGFFTLPSGRTLIHNAAMFGVLSVGAAVVIISGGIDLSVGSVVALSSVIVALLITRWLPGLVGLGNGTPPGWVVALAIGLTMGMGLLIGLAHAGMINFLRLPPFIATLATMAGLRSLAMIACQNRPVTVNIASFRFLGNDPWYTVPTFGTVAVLTSLLMGCTVLGRHLYALGGNEAAARLSGLRTRHLKAFAYGLAGALSALGGILFTGKSGQGQATMGVAYELYAITAAVVGGCSLAGGVGSIRGTVLGLLLIQVVIKGTGQVVRGIDSTQIEGLVLGTVVVLAVAFNQRVRGRG